MATDHRISRLVAAIGCAFGMLFGGAVQASDIDPSTLALLREIKPLTGDLERYRYLLIAMHKLPPAQRLVGRQLLATTESELGLYSQALRDFPIDSRKIYSDPLPAPEQWQAVDAAAAITRLAEGRRLVLINEAHHDPHTRQLTLELLPRLKAAGFTHFAAEALGDEDTDLVKRGYPLVSSGSEYLHEPLYGEIVRKALQLGFIVVPYESDSSSTAARESGQARHLYERVFAGHPQARLFVHAGYAHIDKVKGRLGGAAPMAAELARLSGIEPLSIEQTQFREANPLVPHAAYDQLVAAFHPAIPVVLERKPGAAAGPAVWSSDPDLHDVSVILPPDGNSPKDTRAVPGWYTLDGAVTPAKPAGEDEKRPDWLGLDGQRLPLAISGSLCKQHFPCLVEAFYAPESDTAVAADRFSFLQTESQSALYLFPGPYRLRVSDADGHVVSERSVSIARASP